MLYRDFHKLKLIFLSINSTTKVLYHIPVFIESIQKHFNELNIFLLYFIYIIPRKFCKRYRQRGVSKIVVKLYAMLPYTHILFH